MTELVSEEIVRENFLTILRFEPSHVQASAYQRFTVQLVQDDLLGLSEGFMNPLIQLYQSVFDRVPDLAGYDFWLQSYDEWQRGPLTLEQIAYSFAASPEFQERYAGLSDRGIVEKMYENVLQRPGEEAGVTFWTDALTNWGATDGKDVALSRLVYAISQSQEFAAATKDYIWGWREAIADKAPILDGSLFNPELLERIGGDTVELQGVAAAPNYDGFL